jgi:hypothetical protein
MQARPDDNESIERELRLIQKYFGDVLSKYNFNLTDKNTLLITYENECFTLFFAYDYNQWGYMLYGGIGIGVKKTGEKYWLDQILPVLTGNKTYNFEKETEAYIAQSSRGMIEFEAQRQLWAPYIADTFKNCDPVWDKAL